jgi:hypothetical protein
LAHTNEYLTTLDTFLDLMYFVGPNKVTPFVINLTDDQQEFLNFKLLTHFNQHTLKCAKIATGLQFN